jgi:hypothetical protein
MLGEATSPRLTKISFQPSFWSLPTLAKTVGGIWFAIGLLYVGIKTRGFRAAPVMINFGES